MLRPSPVRVGRPVCYPVCHPMYLSRHGAGEIKPSALHARRCFHCVTTSITSSFPEFLHDSKLTVLYGQEEAQSQGTPASPKFTLTTQTATPPNPHLLCSVFVCFVFVFFLQCWDGTQVLDKPSIPGLLVAWHPFQKVLPSVPPALPDSGYLAFLPFP